MKEIRPAMIIWGAVSALLMLCIGLSGLLGLQSNYIVSAAKICIGPALLMFAVCLAMVINKSSRDKNSIEK